jgi:NAD(P)-dependent dehydrogenase (short-subunit alcohol dehydrogenase family)
MAQVLIIGASKGIGLETTRQALEAGHTVRAEAAHVNAMVAVVEAEAVTAAPDLRNGLLSLTAFARRAVDRHVGIVFVIS